MRGLQPDLGKRYRRLGSTLNWRRYHDSTKHSAELLMRGFSRFEEPLIEGLALGQFADDELSKFGHLIDPQTRPGSTHPFSINSPVPRESRFGLDIVRLPDDAGTFLASRARLWLPVRMMRHDFAAARQDTGEFAMRCAVPDTRVSAAL